MERVEPALLLPEQEAEFANAPNDIKYLIRKYYPLVWNKPSKYLETGFVITLFGLIEHARAAEKDEAKAGRAADVEGRAAGRVKRAKNAEKSAEWVEWHRGCTARKAWVEAKNAEWRARVAARKAAIAGWDAHVEEARVAYQEAKLTPVPAQPV